MQLSNGDLRLGLPKGRMQEKVFELLRNAGIYIDIPRRGYRPQVSLSGFDVKILKPQNIVKMLHLGSRDIGFAGADWVAEFQADIIELLDTELDPVSLVAAAPKELINNGGLLNKRVVIASEFACLTANWISQNNIDAVFVHSYGATEVFPPDDADCIVDIAATGRTLKANNLVSFDTLMNSSTRLYANPRVMDNPQNRERCETLVMLLKSVLEARDRVVIEVNISGEKLASMVKILPCMRRPTISPLDGEDGYAVKVAAPRKGLPEVIQKIKQYGGTDIVVSPIRQIIP